MAELFIPVMSHFLNGNPWSASDGRMRYRVRPTLAEKPEEEGVLTAQVWEGPWAFEFSAVEEERTFPLSPEGLEALERWLEEWSGTINARPRRSLEEEIARRRPEKSD